MCSPDLGMGVRANVLKIPDPGLPGLQVECRGHLEEQVGVTPLDLMLETSHWAPEVVTFPGRGLKLCAPPQPWHPALWVYLAVGSVLGRGAHHGAGRAP